MINKIYPRDQIRKYLLIDTFAVFILTYIVFISESSASIIVKLLLLFLFYCSFYLSLWFRDWRLLVATILGCVTLTLLTIYMEYSFLYFGFIFAELLGRAKSKIHIGVGMLAIAAMFIFVQWYEDGTLTSMEPVMLLIMLLQLLLPIIIHIREKTKTLESELHSANKQIEKYIQEEERHRIARDLHDTLGQTLTMIKLKSELTMVLIDKNSQQAKVELNDILKTSRIALKQVRELVTDMKFISLEEEIARSGSLLKEANIELIVEKKKSPFLMSVEETMLSLSLREAITNTIRHSKARKCMIKMEANKDYFRIFISDDGIGFKSQTIGNGIQSMKERLRTLKGNAEINSASNEGTIVTLTLPLNQHGKENSVV